MSAWPRRPTINENEARHPMPLLITPKGQLHYLKKIALQFFSRIFSCNNNIFTKNVAIILLSFCDVGYHVANPCLAKPLLDGLICVLFPECHLVEAVSGFPGSALFSPFYLRDCTTSPVAAISCKLSTAQSLSVPPRQPLCSLPFLGPEV